MSGPYTIVCGGELVAHRVNVDDAYDMANKAWYETKHEVLTVDADTGRVYAVITDWEHR